MMKASSLLSSSSNNGKKSIDSLYSIYLFVFYISIIRYEIPVMDLESNDAKDEEL